MRLLADQRRRVAAASVAVAALSAAAVAAPIATQSAAHAVSPDAQRVLVRAMPGAKSAAATAVRAAGGTVVRDLPIIDGVSAIVPRAVLGSLSHRPQILSVTPDAAVHLTAASYGAVPAPAAYSTLTGASEAWAKGATGAGVTVAVLDTGVAAVPDLAGRVVAGPDFSGERNSTHDSYGHGTVMAGIVAGDGTSSASLAGGAYVGMAPKARVLSVKVAGRGGATDVSTVLAGLQWVASHSADYGIRVLSLSWGTSSKQSAAIDPLDFAVERVWRQGVVVVVAAGNSGPGLGTITKPGDDPLVLTAGAYDDHHDLLQDNDRVTDWSSRGPTVDGISKPDLVAPGRTVVSTVDPHSLVALQHPEALVAPGYIVGSGTSQSAAVTSGAVALLLSTRPTLTPDQVKSVLRSGAERIQSTDSTAQGRGRLDVGNALEAEPSSSSQTSKATGLGSVEASRGHRHLLTTCPGAASPSVIVGEMDALCRPWRPAPWTADSWTADSWTADSWTADSWTNAFWGLAPPWWQPVAGEPSAVAAPR